MDGFILFNDLQFVFLRENKTNPDLSSFMFEEERGENDYWIFNGGFIEDAGEEGEYGCGYGEYVEFELIRKENSFLCKSRVYIPEPPLPPK
jgi:hypothetical protein